MRIGDRIRLRLINAATARDFSTQIKGGEGVIVAYDGMPLLNPQPLSELTLAPAQRADVIFDVKQSVEFFLLTRQGSYELGVIPVDGENEAPIDEPVQPLPSANIAKPDLDSAENHILTMQGGAMGGRHEGDNIWALNGYSGMPKEPWLRLKRNQTALITLNNETAFPHGMHLHGHHFYEMSKNGELGHFRDTTLVQPRESITIACVFHNSGKWLYHCHTLGHQASGLKTWVEVA